MVFAINSTRTQHIEKNDGQFYSEARVRLHSILMGREWFITGKIRHARTEQPKAIWQGVQVGSLLGSLCEACLLHVRFLEETERDGGTISQFEGK